MKLDMYYACQQGWYRESKPRPFFGIEVFLCVHLKGGNLYERTIARY